MRHNSIQKHTWEAKMDEMGKMSVSIKGELTKGLGTNDTVAVQLPYKQKREPAGLAYAPPPSRQSGPSLKGPPDLS